MKATITAVTLSIKKAKHAGASAGAVQRQDRREPEHCRR
jgi:hypothetical protein